VLAIEPSSLLLINTELHRQKIGVGCDFDELEEECVFRKVLQGLVGSSEFPKQQQRN
jgi:hypothetical protein